MPYVETVHGDGTPYMEPLTVYAPPGGTVVSSVMPGTAARPPIPTRFAYLPEADGMYVHNVRMFVYVCVHRNTHPNTHRYIHTHTHTNTHTQSPRSTTQCTSASPRAIWWGPWATTAHQHAPTRPCGALTSATAQSTALRTRREVSRTTAALTRILQV